MARTRDALICGLLLWGSARAAPPGSAAASRDLGTTDAGSTAGSGRRLAGRFLHVTDFHPDPFYKTYSSTEQGAACHRKHGPAGVYGAETSDCDSPFSLVNQTFKWINDNIKDDIDFVIWTGDSARHDNDDELPRTQKEVIELNEFLVSKFAEVFGQKDNHDAPTNDFRIPVVPTFGNNDIMPHNIFLSGPNMWTTEYLGIWQSMIPEAQRHQFQQGGWFSVEVIPGKLAAISLNTMYFFSSNSAVDGCASRKEPGYEHMEWLRVQLQILRDRGMKAILMGHVPPARVDNKESWDETCWQKYTLWMRQFRDVVVGSIYGHMNVDHFMLQDFDDISKDAEKGRMPGTESLFAGEDNQSLYQDGEVTVASASDYLLDLRQAWAQLPTPPKKSTKNGHSKNSIWDWLLSNVKRPGKGGKGGKGDKSEKKQYLDKIGGKFAERYAVTHVGPSIVPNYYPTLRIIEYNITGLEHIKLPPIQSGSHQAPIRSSRSDDEEEYMRDVEAALKKHKKKKGKKRPKKYKFKVPRGPSKSTPPGPAYSPQTLTFTRTIQYFANLTNINNDFLDPQRHFGESPSPHAQAYLDSTSTNDVDPHVIFDLKIGSDGRLENARWKEGKHGRHQGKKPRPKPHPKKFTFEIEYDTKKDKGFPDLTVKRWVEYARKIGQGVHKRADNTEIEEDDDIENEISEDREELETDEQYPEEDENDDDEHDSLDVSSSKGKKKHKKKKHASKEWFTFVKRAFVGTMDAHDIDALYGASASAEPLEEAQENMEL